MRNLVALGLCFLFIGQNGIAWAAEESTPAQVGYGVGGALGTLAYAPAKGLFCVFGAIGSVFALPWGTSSAEKVVGTTCRGTWVITPEARQRSGDGGMDMSCTEVMPYCIAWLRNRRVSSSAFSSLASSLSRR